MPKIMLVEDDNNLREIYGERLMAEGYDIVSASDGEEALAMAVKERPDLIIADVMMPKISGFDMLDILRQTPETKNTKVIMMTALSQSEDKERAAKLGSDKYLVKSQVTLEDVARVVHDILYGEENPTPAPAQSSPLEGQAQATNAFTPNMPVVDSPQPAPAVATSSIFDAQPVVATTAVASEPATDQTSTLNDNPPAMVAPVAEPAITDNTPPATTTPPIVEPAQAPAPVGTSNTDYHAPEEAKANPFTGETMASEVSHTNITGSASASSTQDESADITRQIKAFENSTVDDTTTHQAEFVEPPEQAIVHASNASEDPTIIKPEEAATDQGKPGMKIIQPLEQSEDPSDKIHRLYEDEMKKQASQMPATNPGVGSVVNMASAGVANPISGDDTPPPLETIDVNQIQGASTESQDGPEDPNQISL